MTGPKYDAISRGDVGVGGLDEPLFPDQKNLPDFGPPLPPPGAPDPSSFYDQTTAPVNPDAAKALAFYGQTADTKQLSTSVDLAHTTTPDKHAQVLQLAARTGFPIDFIQRNVDLVQREADRRDFNADQFRRTSPALADWLRDPDHAMVAGDDHSILQRIELQVRSIGNAFMRGIGKGAQQEELVPLSSQAARAAGGFDTELTPEQQNRRALLQQQMAAGDSVSADPTRGNAPFASEQIGYQGRQLVTTTKVGGVPAMLGAAAGTAFAGATGQPELIPAAARAGAGAGLLVGGFKYSFDAEMAFAFDEYQQMRDEKGQPMDPKVAAIASAGVGAVNALLETVGERAMLTLVPGLKGMLGVGGLTGTAATKEAVREALLKPTVRTALLAVGKEWVKAATIETLTEMAQEVSAIIGREASKTVSGQTFATEPEGSYIQRVRDVGVQTAIGSLGVGAALSVPGAAHETRAVREARHVTEAFKALGEQVKESKLAERLPEAFQDFVARAKVEGPVENVYVPIDAWQTLFQSQPGAAAEAATQVTGSPEQYTEAVATGGDLVIPLEAYAAKVAGTPLNERLLPDIRLHQGAMSLREAEEQAKAMEGVAGPIPDEPILTPEEKAAEKFQTGIEAQLQETGATPAEAETQAQVPTAFFRTLGTRLGQNLFERYRVNIARRETVEQVVAPSVAVKSPGGETVEVPQLEPGAKRKPIARQSVGELFDHFAATVKFLQEPGFVVAPWTRFDDDVQMQRTGGEGLGPSIVKNAQATYDKILTRLKAAGYTEQQIFDRLDDLQAERDTQEGMATDASLRPARGSLSPDVPFAPGATILFQRNAQLAGPTNAELLGSEPKGDAEGTPAERELFKAWSTLNKIDQKEQPIRSGPLGIGDRISQGEGDQAVRADDGKIYRSDREHGDMIADLRDDGVEITKPTTWVRGWWLDKRFVSMQEYQDAVDAEAKANKRTPGDPAELAVARQHLIDAETNVVREKQGLPPVQTPVELPAVPEPGGPSLAEFEKEMRARLGEAGLKQDERGAIQFSGAGPIREFNISLLPKADRSTFLHETGHLFLEVMSDLSAGADVPEQVAADMQTIRDWLGNDGTPFTEAQHEQFARGIEAYLLEGKAPSAPLRQAFARFRTWLVSIYRELRGLNVTLTPEVKSMMDRLLATDDEITAAQQAQDYRPMEQASLGATGAEYAAYTRATDRATTGAQDELVARLMAEEHRQSKAWWQAEEERVRADVAAELESDPAYQAIHYLKRGESLTGETLPVAEDGKPVKLSKDLLVQRYGKDILAELPRGLYAAAGGADPDQIAHLFGFDSGDDMVPALISKRTAPLQAEIERQTAARMAAEHPDLLHDSAALARAAQDAVHRGAQSDVLLTELRLLGRQLGIRLPPRIDNIREQAEALVGRNRVRDLSPYSYQQAEAKNARLAEQALRKGDLPAAAEFKRKQLLNHLAFRTATDLQEQAAKDAGYLQRYTETPARARLGKIGQSFLEQVDGLLERFEFKNRSLREIDRRERLAQWAEDRAEEGTPPEISEALKTESFQTNWRNLTPGQLSDLRGAVQSIVHIAGLQDKLLTLQREARLEEVTTEAGASIREHGGPVREERIGAPSGLERKIALAGQYMASMRKLGSIVRELDGQQDNGPMFRYFLSPINDAQNHEATELVKAGHALDSLFDRHYDRNESGDMSRVRTAVPGTDLRLTHWDRLMIALNTGNEDNRTKLLAGYNGLDESKLAAVLDTLDKRDWEFVQGVWDLIGSYWPEIKAKQERVTGLAPEKVEARRVVTRFGEYAGGYFPLVYDPEQSPAAYKDRIAEQADLMKRGAATRATTRRGHTMDRVEGVERPVLLQPSVITNHLTNVIHDLTHHEMLIDVNRLLRHPAIESAIREHYGNQTLREMQGHLTDIAAGSAGVGKAGEQFISYLRSGATVALLGFNVVTTMLQGLGLSNSVVRIGAPWVARGMARWIQSGPSGQEHTLAWIQERSEFMQNRLQNTQRDLREALTKIEQPGRFTDLKASYFTLIARGQLMADIPTWLGAYEKAWATVDGVTDRDAIALADQAVKDSQGGGMLVDLSRVEKGGPWQKLFTTFYTYGNVVLQQNLELAKRTNFKNPASAGAFLVDALMLNVFPVAVGYLIRSALQGHEPDPKELPGEIAAGLLNMLVYFREFVGLAQHRDSYEGPAGLRVIPQTYTLAQQIRQGEADAAFWRSLNIEAGLIFHYPALQLQRTAEGGAALFSGKTRNPFALVGGAPR